MNNLPPNSWSTEDFFELEQIIAGAKEFVQPSPNFRSAVLDSVGQWEVQQLQLSKLRSLIMWVLIAWLLFLLVYFGSGIFSGSRETKSLEPIALPATQYHSSPGYSVK